MQQLQLEHREWVNKKYPGQQPKIPAVGCLEEAGELVHALLKIEQVETWGENARHKLAELRVKLTDAIGDCGIYACSLCNANDWYFYLIWLGARRVHITNALDAAIQLVRAGTEVALQPSNWQSLGEYLNQLKTVAYILGLDAEAIIKATWITVKER